MTTTSTDTPSGHPSTSSDSSDFPPMLSAFQKWMTRLALLLGILGVLHLATWSGYAKECWFVEECCFVVSSLSAYFFLALFPVGAFLWLYNRHDKKTHEMRLLDHSVVDSILAESRTIEPRLQSPTRHPVNYDEKTTQLQDEASRVEQLGPYGWTEYQVLSLTQLLVDFLRPHDLVARSQSTLAALEDYAQDTSYGGYDQKQYGQWAERVALAISKITNADKLPEPKITDEDESDDGTGNANPEFEYEVHLLHLDKSAENLRAVLRTLLEHVADYESNWAQGSAIFRALALFIVLTIPVLVGAGLIPVLHANGTGFLSFIHWAFIGVAGSLSAVLLTLYNSDIVEMGNTAGKKELWRTVHGAGLGMVAGVLAYSLIAGELLAGNAFPIVSDDVAIDLTNAGLSVAAAFAAGFSFEAIFARIRSAVPGTSG